jgi:hypothetical protein
MLYVYLNFIKDNDIDIYNEWALPITKTINFFRSIYNWIASIIFFPIFIIGMIIEENREVIQKKLNIYTN